MVEQFARQHAKDLKVVGLGTQDDLTEAADFLADNGVTHQLVWDGSGKSWRYVEISSQPASVLVAPDGFASPGFEYGKKPEVPAAVKLMRYVLPQALLRMSLAPAYANPQTLTNELATRYHDLMLAPGSRDALIARMEQTTLVDPVPWLRRIRAPTLLLWGEQDAMIPFGNSADYLKAIANVSLVSLPGVGHLPQEESAERGLAAVTSFLDSPAQRMP